MQTNFEYLANLGALELTGICGFFFYICSFGAVQFNLLDGNSNTYSILNVIAASLVAVSLLAEFNLSSALIQTSWITIGLIGLSMRALKSSRVRAAFSNGTKSKEVYDVLR